MKLLANLEKSLSFWFLIIISFIFFILRLPSLFEPLWYGDEGIYQVLGLGINAGRLLYRDIFDNKPPLLYLLYSFVNSDQFAIRLLSLIFGLLSIWGFYILSKKILKNQKAIFVTTTFFAILFGLPLIEGNIANAENFMLLPNIIAAIMILKFSESMRKSEKVFFIAASGLILGISFLFKIVAIFDFAAFLSFILIIGFPKKIKDILNRKYLFNEITIIATYSLSFALPIIITTIYFMLNNSLPYFLKAALFNNVGYVGYGNALIIPQGLLIFKLILLIIFLFYIFLKRNVIEKAFIFTCVWFAFSLFDTFFSQRPYTHYVLMFIPSFSLMLGMMILKNKQSKFAGVITLSAFIIILLNFNFYIKTYNYYQNFISFLTGEKSITEYRRYFDGNTPKDYEVADYILLHTKPDTKIFLWGNSAQVYTLTNKLPPGRYTVAYHITSFSDGLENTKQNLQNNTPQLIIIYPNVPPYPFSLSSYRLKLNLSGLNIYEKFN